MNDEQTKGELTKLYLLTCNGFDNQFVTPEVYGELIIKMSTGDFHTHKAVPFYGVAGRDFEWSEVVTLESLKESAK